MTTMSYGDVPLLDPVNGRFSDSFAPPSVASDKAAAAQSAIDAAAAKDAAAGSAGTASAQAGIATTKAGDAEIARAAAVVAKTAAESARDVAGSSAALVQQVTLTGNLAYTLPTGLPANIVQRVTFTQDSTGGHTVTYGGASVAVDKAPGASTPIDLRPLGGGAYAVTYPASQRPVPRAPIGATTMHAWGDSYVNGAGASIQANRFTSKVSAALGLTLDSHYWASAYGDNAWGSALQSIPGTTTFSPPKELYVIKWGINDLATLNSAGTGLYERYSRAMATVISRARAGAVFENSDSSFAFDTFSTMTLAAANGGASGVDVRYTTNPARTYSITTPASFPGGTVTVGLFSQSVVGHGATHTATIEGRTIVCPAYTVAAEASTCHTLMRIPNVPPGVHTIAVAVSNFGVGSLTGVDYWQWECPATSGPVVVLVKQPLCPSYTAYGASAMTDADVVIVNAIIDNLAATFGPRVVVAESHLLPMAKNAAYFIPDNLHPNDAGHELMAQAVLDALAPFRP